MERQFLEDVYRDFVAAVDFGKDARQAKPFESNVDESPGDFGSKALPPKSPGDIERQIDLRGLAGSTQSTAADVGILGFAYRGPQTKTSVGWPR